MKLLKEYDSVTDAEMVASNLEKKGIAVFVSSKYSQSLSKYRTGALKSGLWIVIDSQYIDAKEVLLNKRHEVFSALSPEEIRIIKNEMANSSNGLILKTLVYTLCFLLVLVVFIVYIGP